MSESYEERWLFQCLTTVLNGGDVREGLSELPAPDWNRLLRMAQSHAVLPLLYPLLEQGYEIPDSLAACIRDESRQTVQQSYRLMFLTHYLVGRLERQGIAVAVLKGVAVSGYYPVPELRKSGDVDLLLMNAKELGAAERVMAEAGFTKRKEQASFYHQAWRTDEGIDIELHVMLTEPFDDRRINDVLERQLQDMRGRIRRDAVMGLEFPVLGDSDHAYYLLLHMLHHFLRTGFGIKLLCDWVVFWNRPRPEKERERYRQHISETGLEGFSDMVTGLCTEYLGLSRACADPIVGVRYRPNEYREFMREIMDAGEFGMLEEGRMVIVRGRGLVGFAREFQHQMRLNFPKKGNIPPLWPMLWVVTLVRFLKNNRRIRGISAFRIWKKAWERSRQVRRLKLFQRRK